MTDKGVAERVFGKEGVMTKLRRRSSSKTTAPSSADIWKSILLDAKADFERKWLVNNTDQVRTTLSDFEIRSTIGTGSFARVLLVRHKFDHKFYALKVLNKLQVIKKKQVEHTHSEKDILQAINFPFIVSLRYCFQDNSNLYLALDFVNGGEMFTHLRRTGRFSEAQSRFYIAQLVLVVEYMNACNIVYRDLKPENLLITVDGYLKVTDFGFAKRLHGRTYTLCGTPDYLAPEIVLAKGYGMSVDWWALGVLLFEMTAGYPPFYSDQPIKTYEMIVDGRVVYPSNMSTELKDLLRNMLQVDVTRRYGCMKGGANDVKEHRWFASIDWIGIYLKNIPAPFIPVCGAGPGDTGNFEKFDEQPIYITTDRDEGENLFANF